MRSSRIIRKCSLILSLSGLALSLALWCLSYFSARYDLQSEESVRLMYGTVDWLHPSPRQRKMWKMISRWPRLLGSRPRYHIGQFQGLKTDWRPAYMKYPTSGMVRVIIPLWIPSVFFAILCAVAIVPTSRQRKREKEGLCSRCGYNLTSNTSGICPECGTPISKETQEKPATNRPSSEMVQRRKGVRLLYLLGLQPSSGAEGRLQAQLGCGSGLPGLEDKVARPLFRSHFGPTPRSRDE